MIPPDRGIPDSMPGGNSIGRKTTNDSQPDQGALESKPEDTMAAIDGISLGPPEGGEDG